MIRKLFITCIAMMIVAIGVTFYSYSYAEIFDYRSAHGIIVEASLLDGSATVMTDDGNLWTIDIEDWDIRDECFVVFNTVGTEPITDDQIIACFYIHK